MVLVAIKRERAGESEGFLCCGAVYYECNRRTLIETITKAQGDGGVPRGFYSHKIFSENTLSYH